MTSVTDDVYSGGVIEADFDVPDEPEPDEELPELPEGVTVDRRTGEVREKRRPGRPRKPPSPEELAGREPGPRAGDKPPGQPDKATRTPPDVRMPRAGVIAAGVNKMYRRAGKIVRGMEHGQRDGIGQAIIEATKADPETEWPTVGEAWENLARTNPRIRAFLLRAIEGEGWIELAMAHAPIAVAVIMKPAVRKRVPVIDIMRSWGEREDDEGEGEGPQLAGLDGLTEDDMRQMAEQAGMDIDQMAAMAARMSAKLPPDVAAAAERASREQNPRGLTPVFDPPPEGSDRLPPAYRRQQPKNQSRAQRARAAR